MVGVITGDIINSQLCDPESWIPELKLLFEKLGKTPKDWEIYRGDEFQVKTEPENAYWVALCIKSLIKRIDRLDVRLAIGIGDEKYAAEKITESNGTAYVNSGRLLNEIKIHHRNLAVRTQDVELDTTLNLLFDWAILDFDAWTPVVAEVLYDIMIHRGVTQEELAKKLNITQSSVSQRIKRTNIDLILETDQYFRNKIATLR